MPAVAKVVLGGLAHVLGRRRVHPVEIGLDEIRIVRVELALGQRDGLAAEAADLLQPAHRGGVDAGDGALELFRRRTALAERRDDVVDGLARHVGLLPGIERDREVEHA